VAFPCIVQHADSQDDFWVIKLMSAIAWEIPLLFVLFRELQAGVYS